MPGSSSLVNNSSSTLGLCYIASKSHFPGVPNQTLHPPKNSCRNRTRIKSSLNQDFDSVSTWRECARACCAMNVWFLLCESIYLKFQSWGIWRGWDNYPKNRSLNAHFVTVGSKPSDTQQRSCFDPCHNRRSLFRACWLICQLFCAISYMYMLQL